MCGILCSLSSKTSDNNNYSEFIKHSERLLKRRGPDICSEHRKECENFVVNFFGFVLWQQGVKPTPQPLVDGDHVFLFNGDIYSTTSLDPKPEQQSDTEWLFRRIINCDGESEFLELFTRIHGPFSLIYYNSSTKRLYFARDSLGRQSLLIGSYRNSVYITSVASREFGVESFIEVPPIGIFSFDLANDEFNIYLNSWQDVSTDDHYAKQIRILETLLSKEISLRDTLDLVWKKTDISQSIDYNFQTILSAHLNASRLEVLNKLSHNEDVSKTCDELTNLLTTSVRQRIETTPQLCKNCVKSKLANELQMQHSNCTHPKIGILFSGGIDCSILAVLANKFVDETNAIDLINVSFEKIVRSKSTNEVNYDTPDRLTSRQTLQELKKLCPERQWNLIEVNVSREELRNALRQRISDLCYPLNSVLDESLGAALWFAASGKGEIDGTPYESPCRVLLIGSGADELFGGYTRHRNAFLRSGHSWSILDDELCLDWIRLPSRNLARDDRIIGDNSLTARAPYVEENVAMFVRNLKSSQKCLYLLAEGIGDKLLLRLCGFRLGLRDVCWLKKRALQFGSRVADRKQNAKDVSEALR